MNKSTDEKSLMILNKKNIFARIFEFIINKFKNKKENIQYEAENANNDVIKRKDIVNSIVDEDEIKFQNYRRGYINQENLTEEEIKMIALKYQERIIKEQEQIEFFKRRIMEIRKKYNIV